jgi:hypothetical protein
MNQQKEFNSVWENIYFQLELAHKNKIESAKNRFAKEKENEKYNKRN